MGLGGAVMRWGGVGVGAVVLLGVAAVAGYRLGSARLASGVPAVEMAKVGLRQGAEGNYVGARVAPVWLPDGDRFVYDAARRKTRERKGREWRLVDPATGEDAPFVDERAFQAALSTLFAAPVEESAESLRRFSFVNEDEIEFLFRKRRIRYNRVEKTAAFVAELQNDEDPLVERVVRKSFPAVWADEKEQVSPDRRYVLSADEHDLLLRGADGETRSLTTSGEAYAEWQLNPSQWSPDSRYVAAIHVDAREAGRVPVVDWFDMGAPAHYQSFPMAGRPSLRFSGAIIDVETGAVAPIDYGADFYVRPLTWLDDGSAFLAARLSRDTKVIEVLSIAPETGEARVVLSERTDTYHMFPPNFLFRNGPDFYLFPDNEQFAWITDKSGYRQIYVHSLSGGEGRQLTDELYQVERIGGLDEESGRLLYTAHADPERPYDIHVMGVPLSGGAPVRLSEAPGQHSIEVAPGGGVYVDKYSTTAVPPVVELRSAGGDLVETLSVGERLAAARLLAPPPEHFSALAADGETVIHGVIFKPSDFDPSRKYPIVDSIYGGPAVNHVPQTYDARVPFFGRSLTELGYVVVVVDARGTPGRSKAFKDVVYGRLGQFEIADHEAAIRAAAETRPYMDTSRVGILGHSYGGYFAARALLQAPDFYKVAVASGVPEKDRDVVGMSTEVYLGLYKDHPERFEAASNAPLAGNLKGKLLIAVQTSDVNTPAHGAFKLVSALVENGKPHDVLILPGANHAFRGDIEYRRYFYESIAAYFKEHL